MQTFKGNKSSLYTLYTHTHLHDSNYIYVYIYIYIYLEIVVREHDTGDVVGVLIENDGGVMERRRRDDVGNGVR